MKNGALSALLCTAAAAFACFIKPERPASPSNNAAVITGPSAESAFESRYRAVLAGLDAEKQEEWAGVYRCQGNSSTTVTLYLSFSNGFAWREQGPHWWQNGKGYGGATMKDGKVTLATEGVIEQPPPSGPPSSYRPLPGCLGADLYQVRGGGRHYLVPSDRMINFCEVFNSGNLGDLNQFLLKDGDDQADISGRPDVPEWYVRFLNRSRLLQ